ncbi:MAG: PadR family transcriptional regulator [Longimicrobiales bacterium]
MQLDLLHGTLDLLVLQTLAIAPAHGWGIAQHIEVRSNAFRLNQGSLYPALYRLEDEGLIEGDWSVAEDTRRRVKTYRLTRAGRRQLEAETERWRAYVRAVDLVLGEA